MTQRQFDPEAVGEFKIVLEADLEYLDDQVIPRLRDGDLSYMPAFGLEGVEGKKVEYQTSFGSVWTDVQYMRATIVKMIEALDGIVGDEAEAEAANVAEFEQFLSLGEAVPAETEGDA